VQEMTRRSDVERRPDERSVIPIRRYPGVGSLTDFSEQHCSDLILGWFVYSARRIGIRCSAHNKRDYSRYTQSSPVRARESALGLCPIDIDGRLRPTLLFFLLQTQSAALHPAVEFELNALNRPSVMLMAVNGIPCASPSAGPWSRSRFGRPRFPPRIEAVSAVSQMALRQGNVSPSPFLIGFRGSAT